MTFLYAFAYTLLFLMFSGSVGGKLYLWVSLDRTHLFSLMFLDLFSARRLDSCRLLYISRIEIFIACYHFEFMSFHHILTVISESRHCIV